MSWQDFYGFKPGADGGAGDDECTSAEFRDARRAGYTGMSILEWIKPEGARTPMDHADEPGVWIGATPEGKITSDESIRKP